ncbi:MAG: hypothetical protein KDA35_05275, partial [Hyphomonadaceae bacterium]|nr:hypothetical protein [Hyphomonadaceae bacterium]
MVPAVFAALVALLWSIGAREPVYAISAGVGPHWFIATRGEPGALAPGVGESWRTSTDFTMIGGAPDQAYWQHFIIAAGGDSATLPIALDQVEDAYIARIQLRRPPKLLLGVLKTLIAFRILTKPAGPIVHDPQALGFRADVMPSTASITRLLAQPPTYAPAMINFLAYFKDARYGEPRPGVSGRAAYMRYGLVAMRTVYRTGGHLLFTGRILSTLREPKAGPTVGRWDDL